MRGLKDRVAVVTGAGGAIGRSICLRFGEEGALVVALDRDGVGANRTRDAIVAAGGKARAATVDIGDYAAVEAAIREAEGELGPTDVLVNCAGWDRLAQFLDTEPSFWDELIRVNLRGPLNLHHVVGKGMAERGKGRIVNIGSDAGRVGSSGEAVYAACKGGIIAFSKAIARELAPRGISVNVVCPGPTDTPLLRSFLDEGEYGQKIFDSLKRVIPFRRLGQPDDIAPIVVFLASDEAAFITGQVISVSGGLTMHG